MTTPDACIDLSDNTNLWGPPPSAPDAVQALGAEKLSRYPCVYSSALRKLLGEYAGVSAEMIVTGCGSDDVLDSAIRAFAKPGDSLCFPDPTFSMVPVFAEVNRLTPVAVPFEKDWSLDPQRVLESRARVIYLCTPNNPTGTTLSRATVERIVSEAPGLVIIDEAYVEFGGESFVRLVAGGQVLVTRTMSKAFGLAGLRIGYGIASPEIVAAVEKSRGPYTVGTAAEAAAIAVLKQDRNWVTARITDVRDNRARLMSGLAAIGYAPIASSANFVLVPVADLQAELERLRNAGVGVRGLPGLNGIGDALRITIGPWEMMQSCLDALGNAK